jgi:hypothetical protein
MTRNRWSVEEWIGLVVRLFFGAVLGVLVGLSWVLWVSPIEHTTVNWVLFGLVVVVCALLSLRYGDDLWTHLKDWI